MKSEYLKQESEAAKDLTRSLKQAVRAKTAYNDASTRRTSSISEQIILDALGGAGT